MANGQNGKAHWGLLFDFDGVIADSEPLHWRAWLELLKPFNVEINWEEYCRNCRGLPDYDMPRALRRIRPNAGPIEQALPALYTRRKELVAQWIAESPVTCEATLRMLRSLDLPLGLVTTALRVEVEPALDCTGIRDCFGAIVFGDDVERHKPHPDAYLLAARKLGVTEAIVFEDSDAGMASGAAAGFRVVRITEPARLAEIVGQEIRALNVR